MTDFFTMLPGETAAPVPPGPVLSTGSVGVRRVYRFILWAYDEAPGLVRSVAPGDVRRAAYVGDVLGNFDKVLWVHNEGQDLFMYPRLAERAPDSASHTGEMLDQHQQIRRHIQNLEPLRKRWMQTADAATSHELAAGYEGLQGILSEHLRREVTEVMPAVDRVMTEEELKEMIQHGVRQHDKKFLVTYLGMVLATNPPDDRRAIYSSMRSRPQSASATASSAAGYTAGSTPRSSRDGRSPRRCSGPALGSVVFPYRRIAPTPDLPRVGTRRNPRLHRRETRLPCPPRQRARVAPVDAQEPSTECDAGETTSATGGASK